MIRFGTGLDAAVTRLGVVCVLLTGCATAGRTLDGFYVDEAKGFRVQLPRDGWQIMEPLPGADLAVRDVQSDAHMAVSASCPERERGPLPALVQHLFFGLRDVERLHEERIMVDGAVGINAVIKASWEGRPVQIRSVVIQRKGCLYDLIYVAPPETFAVRSADFDAFLGGWQFLLEGP